MEDMYFFEKKNLLKIENFLYSATLYYQILIEELKEKVIRNALNHDKIDILLDDSSYFQWDRDKSYFNEVRTNVKKGESLNFQIASRYLDEVQKVKAMSEKLIGLHKDSFIYSELGDEKLKEPSEYPNSESFITVEMCDLFLKTDIWVYNGLSSQKGWTNYDKSDRSWDKYEDLEFAVSMIYDILIPVAIDINEGLSAILEPYILAQKMRKGKHLRPTWEFALYVYFLGKINVDKEIMLDGSNDSKEQYERHIIIFNNALGHEKYKLDTVKVRLESFRFALDNKCKLTEYKQVEKFQNVRDYMLYHLPDKKDEILSVFEPYLQ
jgi:hypothetical protein